MAAAADALVVEAFLADCSQLDMVLTLFGFDDPALHASLIQFASLIDDLDTFGDFRNTDINNMTKRNESCTPSVQHVLFGIQSILHLKAISFWVSMCHLCKGMSQRRKHRMKHCFV
jgi:hypothetical protein